MTQTKQLETFLEQYHTTVHGLTSEEAKKRLAENGPNSLQAKKKKSLFMEFLAEFKDLMVIILIAAGTFAFFSGETTDSAIIFFIVILNAWIGFIQKYKAEKAIEALRKMISPKARVLRNGQQHKIPASDLVVGDILILEEGDTVNADAVIYEENELEAQEAILTGESSPVEKASLYNEQKWQHEMEISQKDVTNDDAPHSAKDHTVFMGTMITHGSARAVVVTTGMSTEMGKIATLTTETIKDKSPLEKELHNIGLFVGKITFGIIGTLVFIGVFFQNKGLVDTLIFATSVAVAAVPEGLPATITIALAIGVQRLAKNNAIVKQLSSVETLGATTVICSDKTGTLTKNEMTVTEIYFDRYSAKVEGVGYDPKGTVQIDNPGKTPIILNGTAELEKLAQQYPEMYGTMELLLLTAGLCNNAALEFDNNTWKILGDPTEAALLTAIKKSGIDLKEAKTRFQIIHTYPFDSTRKRMTVLVKVLNPEKPDAEEIFVMTKGAPGSILGVCDHVMLNNHSVKIDDGTYKDFLAKNEKMARSALRCLGFAYRELTPHELRKIKQEVKGKIQLTQKDVEQNMTFLGLMGMIDPPREEVPKAIEMAQKAGIKIYIITGDHGLTAEAVAKQIGLLQGQTHQIVFGDHLETMTVPELKKLLAQKHLDIIFARVSPAHKLKIVSALKELGEVVAVTGDGVNDAPALKRADIGIAMGKTGTDVSKEAANMILNDDSFATIVKAIQEGRTIYENLKKSIFYVFSSNMGELLIIFGAIMLNLPMPLTAILILFVNLTTDVLPAIALGIEPTEKDIMDKNPRHPKQKILNRDFIIHFLYIGLVIGALTLIAYMWDLTRLHVVFDQHMTRTNLDYLKASSMAFLLLVTVELGHALNSRSNEMSLFKMKFMGNPKLIGGIAASWILTVILVEVPFFQKFFHTAALDGVEWLMVGVSFILMIMAEEIRKLIKHRHTPKVKILPTNHAH